MPLGATSRDHLIIAPIKLVLDEARIRGRDRGMSVFHLGGGRGGDEDGLFRFKSGFADKFQTFRTWRFVADPGAYTELTMARGLQNDEHAEFFPRYRAISASG